VGWLTHGDSASYLREKEKREFNLEKAEKVIKSIKVRNSSE
jgi:hypothetical protein